MGSPGTGEVMADMANYTNIQPVIQTSEIVGYNGVTAATRPS